MVYYLTFTKVRLFKLENISLLSSSLAFCACEIKKVRKIIRRSALKVLQQICYYMYQDTFWFGFLECLSLVRKYVRVKVLRVFCPSVTSNTVTSLKIIMKFMLTLYRTETLTHLGKISRIIAVK